MTSGRRLARAAYNAAVYPAGPPPMMIRSRSSLMASQYSTPPVGRLFPFAATTIAGPRAWGNDGRDADLGPAPRARGLPRCRRLRDQLVPQPRPRGRPDAAGRGLAGERARLRRREADRVEARRALARPTRGGEARRQSDPRVLRQRVQPGGRTRVCRVRR